MKTKIINIFTWGCGKCQYRHLHHYSRYQSQFSFSSFQVVFLVENDMMKSDHFQLKPSFHVISRGFPPAEFERRVKATSWVCKVERSFETAFSGP